MALGEADKLLVSSLTSPVRRQLEGGRGPPAGRAIRKYRVLVTMLGNF